MELYVKPNTNSRGLTLMEFEELGTPRKIEKIKIGQGRGTRWFHIYAHSSLYNHSIHAASACKVRDPKSGSVGYLVYGADFGILISKKPLEGYDPDCQGRPIFWVSDETDLYYKMED